MGSARAIRTVHGGARGRVGRRKRTRRATKAIPTRVAGRSRKRRTSRAPALVALDACIRTASRGEFTLKAYRGDAKTLLAFDLPREQAVDLAGFTIQCQPKGQAAYYLHNMLRFEHPEPHAQDHGEPAQSSVNAPIHKFRWIHVPGQVHQGTEPFFGSYTYTVTPRYFEHGALKPLDPALGASLQIDVAPFQTGALELGFTRGFLQSQAFVRHFGKAAVIKLRDQGLTFDTSQVAGTNDAGQPFTYEQMYSWLGFTARAKLMALFDQIAGDPSLHLDMFAYDLRDPRVVAAVLELARQGRIRLVLDNAALHHDPAKPKPEDQLEAAFRSVASKAAGILRGRFGQYAHDKILIVSRGGVPRKVLTGSTNFSVTGLYVNSNHVLVFDDPAVAATYAEVFEVAWRGQARRDDFVASRPATRIASFSSSTVPRTDITFSPHPPAFASCVLQGIASRIEQEAHTDGGSVLFAMMQLDRLSGPVPPALEALHADQRVFSYGISDTPGGIRLYTRGKRTGVLVTGKPTATRLPPPFCRVPSLGFDHQIHHKFIVCGLTGADPVVYCGSSNLAESSETQNGDNLLAIRDRSVAVVFAIEALGLVDHFNFLDRCARRRPGARRDPARSPRAIEREAAATAGWFLSTTDRWAAPYYDPRDLHCVDRLLFR
jgi:PLD-like domain